MKHLYLLLCCWVGLSSFSLAAEPTDKLANPEIEVQPSDPALTKIVLIAGSNYFKPGEHEYVAGCAVLQNLLKQTKGIAPVLAVDWPKKPETLKGAKAVVFLFDGGDKHALLQGDRFKEVQKLVEAGVGLVHFHQVVDYPKDLGERARPWTGAVWEKGHSQRAHWIGEFKEFTKHPITQGVTPFKIDDGWLFKLRFVADMKNVTPLLSTVSPKVAADQVKSPDAIVGWAYERADGGRSFSFTGCHLHASYAQEGYRRLLVNGILWTAKQTIPEGGAPVMLNENDLPKYLKPAPAKAK